jgi:transposase
LRGYVREGNLSKADGFRLRDFRIEVQQRQVICPAGMKQAKWVRAKPGVNNLIAYHVQFGPQCQLCPHFGPGLCTDKLNGRHLGINAYHDLIQARCPETDTEAFRQEMQIRAGIQGTLSETVRSHGLRRSRYRGTRKNQLRALLGATATNLKRLARCSFLFAWVQI